MNSNVNPALGFETLLGWIITSESPIQRVWVLLFRCSVSCCPNSALDPGMPIYIISRFKKFFGAGLCKGKETAIWGRQNVYSQLHWQKDRISYVSGNGGRDSNEQLISCCVLHSCRLSFSFLTASRGNVCCACQQFNAPADCYHAGDKRNTWAEKLREYLEFKQVLLSVD